MIPQDKISDIQDEIKLLREENRRLHEKLKTDKTKNEDSDEVNFLNSSDLYKYIVRNINEGIWVIDTNGFTIFVNKRILDLLGYEWDEVIGRPVFNFIESDSIPFIREKLQNRAFGISESFEQKLIRKDGTSLWFSLSASPVRNTDGSIMAFFGLFTDITTKKIAEEARRESEAHFKAVFQVSTEGIIIFDPKGNVVSLNDAEWRMYGFSSAEEMMHNLEYFGELFECSDSNGQPFPFNEWPAQHAMRGESVRELELKAIRKDTGQEWFFIYNAEPVFDSNNQLLQVVLFTRDVTDRRKSEQAIRESETRFRSVLDNSMDIIYRLNVQSGQFEYVSPSSETVMGYTPGEYMAMNPKEALDMIHPDDLPLMQNAMLILRETGSARVTYRQRAKSGEYRWISNHMSLTRNNAGEPLYRNGNIRDITELIKTQESLRESRTKLFAAIESIQDAVFISDSEGNFIDFNEAFATFHKFKSKEECYKKLSQYPDYIDVYFSDGSLAPLDMWAVTRALRGETIANAEYILRRKDTGEKWWGSYSFSPIRDIEGKIIGSVVVGRDITEHKMAEEELRESEQKYRNLVTELEAILDATPAGVLVYDKKGKIVRSNAAANNLLLYPDNDKSEPIQERVKRHFEIRDEQGRKMNTEELPAFRVTLKGESVSNIILSLQGHERILWLIFNGAPLKVEGKQTGGVITMVDITSRKLVEEALKESEERFRTMADNISQFAWMADHKGWIFWYNKRWFEYTGTTFEEMQGWGWTKVHHPDHVERVVQNFKKAVETGENWEDTFPLRGKKGDYRWYLSRALPIRDKKGNIIRWFGTNTDITDQRKAEETLQNQNVELQKAKEKAEESDRFKTAFVANISHEIRTPMSGIMGFADLLQSPDLSAESQEKYIDAIVSSGKRMLNIINDLINISKIEAGHVEIKSENVDVYKLVDELLIFFLPETQKKKIILKTDKKIPIEKTVGQTDKTKLSQILINLVKNAMKFTIEGFVELGCNYDNCFWLFYVKDTGIGIKQEDYNKIFERFGQGDVAMNSVQEGVGLGLAISKAYVESLGGSIWVESNSAGSCFYFTIPYKEPEIKRPSAIEKNEKMSLPIVEVLIAEDEDLIFFYLDEVLKLNNIKAHRASNGQEAINLLTLKPDIKLVLMDARMPVMDGFQATREIKKSNPHLPVIVLSALANEDDIQKAYDAGCVDYISKPVNKSDLLYKISLQLATQI